MSVLLGMSSPDIEYNEPARVGQQLHCYAAGSPVACPWCNLCLRVCSKGRGGAMGNVQLLAMCAVHGPAHMHCGGHTAT
jgi:hypothetical protein